MDKEYDVVILGAGILGTSLAYWLSVKYRGNIAIIDQENLPGSHASSRNTGVIHRPFYLNPETKGIFAKSAQDSFALWKELAYRFQLPWKEVGTLEIATKEEDTKTIEKYAHWAIKNGVTQEEFDILDEKGLRNYSGEVKGFGAILSKTDSAVSFGHFARELMDLARNAGVKFIEGLHVNSVSTVNGEIRIKGVKSGNEMAIRSKFLFNVAGGDSLRFAHMFGLAKSYAVLHFRGDYWKVNDTFPRTIGNNIYTVPQHLKFPFLDPHFVIRHDGARELGPNAALVPGPYSYGEGGDDGSLILKLLERPLWPKFKLLVNSEFISLVRTEWKSSRSKEHMADRARKFIPSLSNDYLDGRGISGVRNSLVDSKGFVPEAVIEVGDNSYHVLNYNSPGATGAPAYSRFLLEDFEKRGFGKLDKQPDNSDYPWKSYWH